MCYFDKVVDNDDDVGAVASPRLPVLRRANITTNTYNNIILGKTGVKTCFYLYPYAITKVM